MKPFALTLVVAAALISGCREQPGYRGYWSDRTLDIDDYEAAEEDFTDFVEYAVTIPEAQASADIDQLLEKASQDEITYLFYADWILKGFGSIASPCRSCPLLVHAADWVLAHDLPSWEMKARYEVQRNFCLHNRPGDVAELPDLEEDALAPFRQRTLILVVDQGCSTCRESMARFETPEWDGTDRVALCYGRGPLPENPAWQCYRMSPDQTLLDTRQAPFYYVVSTEGTVEQSYSPVHRYE